MLVNQIRAKLADVRNEIRIRECSDSRAHTGFYRNRMRELLAAEARLTGLLRRLDWPRRGDPHEPEQMEFTFA